MLMDDDEEEEDDDDADVARCSASQSCASHSGSHCTVQCGQAQEVCGEQHRETEEP